MVRLGERNRERETRRNSVTFYLDTINKVRRKCIRCDDEKWDPNRRKNIPFRKKTNPSFLF
jgi:hypothetical protein